MMTSLSKENKLFIKNLILYGVFGGLAALVDFSIFYLMTHEMNLNKFIANIISMHAGMIVSFTLNRNFNFRKKDKLVIRFFTYYAVILTGMALSSFLLWLLGFWIPSKTIVKAITIVVVSGLQFVFNKFVTFNR